MREGQCRSVNDRVVSGIYADRVDSDLANPRCLATSEALQIVSEDSQKLHSENLPVPPVVVSSGRLCEIQTNPKLLKIVL